MQPRADRSDGAQVGLGLVLHQADELIDTRGVPLDDLVAVALLLYFGIRTLQVRSPNLDAQRHSGTCVALGFSLSCTRAL